MVCDMGREYSPVGIGRKLNYILPGLQVKTPVEFPQVKGQGSAGAAERGRARSSALHTAAACGRYKATQLEFLWVDPCLYARSVCYWCFGGD